MALSSRRLPRRLHSEFVKKVEEVSGENLPTCYQCGMCSAGCPMSFAMDILPRQIMHLIQLGLEEDIANCKTIWLCASCLTCAARCPRGVNLCKIMEALRLITLRKNTDYVQLSKIPPDNLAELPQIALISSFRKHTA
jgi:heterodisulfide reductase subunit C2